MSGDALAKEIAKDAELTRTLTQRIEQLQQQAPS